MHVFVFAYRTVAFVPDGEEPTEAILWVSEELVSTWPAVTKGLGAGRYLVDDDYHEVRCCHIAHPGSGSQSSPRRNGRRRPPSPFTF